MSPIKDSVIVCLGLGLAGCILLPIFGLVFAQRKYSRALKPFFLGMLAFFISQILLRLPLIQVFLPQFGWYQTFSASSPVLYCLFLGLTAGVFEETARFFLLKFGFKRNLRFGDGIAFGLGHGGIEALFLTAASLANLLFYALAINNGSFATVTDGAGQAQADQIALTLYNLDGLSVWAGVTERVLAMTAHVGMTMLVVTGLYQKKSKIYFPFAIGVHAAVDTLCGVLPLFGLPVWAVEGVLALCAGLLLFYTVRLKKHIFDTKKGADTL